VTDAIRAAEHYKHPEAVSLLENFKKNPDQTRSDIRLELGITGECAPEFESFLSSFLHNLIIVRFPCYHPSQDDQGRICRLS
jgi:hypothetical protein